MVITEIFKVILNLSISGSFIAILVLLLTEVFRYIPVSRKIGFILWGIVAIKLICPFVIPITVDNDILPERYQAVLDEEDNLFSVRQQVKYDNYTISELAENITAQGETYSNSYLGETVEAVKETESNVYFNWLLQLKVIDVAAIVWFVGVWGFFNYGLISMQSFKKKLMFAMNTREGYYEVDTIDTPCVFGILSPKIYLLPGMDAKEKNYALCHERQHICNRDHIWKVLSYLIICMHWFNIFLWFTYFQFQKYLECNCDEAVIRKIGLDKKEDYCEVILKMVISKRKNIFSVSLSEEFTKNEIKDRIKQILNIKKRRKSLEMVLSVIFVIIGTIFFVGINIQGEEKTNNVNEDELTKFAEQLYENKNEFIGNASGNGALLVVLSDALPASSRTMRLFTGEEPYGLRVVFEKGPQDITDSEKTYEKLYKSSALLLALIDNADRIMWEYPYDETMEEHYAEIREHWTLVRYGLEKDHEFVVQYHDREDIEEVLAVDDIKAYGKSVESILELLKIIQWTDIESSDYISATEIEDVSEEEIYWKWGNVSDSTRIAEIFGIHKDVSEYTDSFHISQTKNGITLTIKEILVAEDRIYTVIYKDWEQSVELAEDLNEPMISVDISKINGEPVTYVSSRSTGDGVNGEPHNEARIMIFENGTLPEVIDSLELTAKAYVSMEPMDSIDFIFTIDLEDKAVRSVSKKIQLEILVEGENGEELIFDNLKLNQIYSQILTIPNEVIIDNLANRQYKLIGQDSLGNSIEYRLSGGTDGKILFEASELIPSMDSEWMELQLYAVDAAVEIIGEKNKIEDEEFFTEEYGASWSEEDYEPISEKIRIVID